MATNPDSEDCDIDTDFISLLPRAVLSQTDAELESKVESLQAKVERLQLCLHDSLKLQRSILHYWDLNIKVGFGTPPAKPNNPAPVSTSTPYAPHPSSWRPQHPNTVTPGYTPPTPASHFQPDSCELSNTSKVPAAALHQAKLEPPVFTGDGVIYPEEWLQSVNTYRSSLNLSDTQVLRELLRFLAKEPKKWFSVLDTHVVSWADFCDLFKMVFLPADNQERVMRGILDRIQRPEKPLPTFVAHMLSEFKKLRSRPSDQEQIVCKHALEK